MKTSTEQRERLPQDEWDAFKVQRLRMKLADKAKRELKFKFYSLYGHICRMDVLKEAWKQVKRNGGSPGVDGVTIGSFDTKAKIEALLETVQKELTEGTYIPQPVKRVFIPKANGKLRPLGIPTVKDRLVQAAVKLILEPIFEQDFRDCSYGFRPAKSAHDALKAVHESLKQGKRQVYDVDIKGYFDSIPHDKLLDCLKMRVTDRRVLKLIKRWLRAPIAEETGRGKGQKMTYPKRGTPQGGVISPLLANIYLHWFDVAFHKADGPWKWAHATLVRYADDFVILAKYQGIRLQEFVKEKIEDWMDLELNQEKSKFSNLNDGDSFDFLGYTYHFQKDLRGRDNKYLCPEPSKKAIKRAKEELKNLTDKRFCWLPIRFQIKKMNQFLDGWSNYFSFGYPRKAKRIINWHARESIQKHLKRRSQRCYRPPEGTSFYEHVYRLGLRYL